MECIRLVFTGYMSERVNAGWAKFGAEIRRLREQTGLSQAKLGEAVGYS